MCAERPRTPTLLTLTPAERRGATVVLLLLLIGTAQDLWRAAQLERRAAASAGSVRGTQPVPSPVTGPGESGSAGAGATAPRADRVGPIDLNRATARELEALPGIGPVLAARIVEHRGRIGSFSSVEDLRAVRGVGPKLFQKLRPHVRVHRLRP